MLQGHFNKDISFTLLTWYSALVLLRSLGEKSMRWDAIFPIIKRLIKVTGNDEKMHTSKMTKKQLKNSHTITSFHCSISLQECRIPPKRWTKTYHSLQSGYRNENYSWLRWELRQVNGNSFRSSRIIQTYSGASTKKHRGRASLTVDPLNYCSKRTQVSFSLDLSHGAWHSWFKEDCENILNSWQGSFGKIERRTTSVLYIQKHETKVHVIQLIILL